MHAASRLSTSSRTMFESDASFFLTKLLPLFVYPLGAAISLAVAGGICAALRLRRLAMLSFFVGLVVLWVSSTPVFAEWALGSLERQYPATTMADTPEADVAIVLGGAVGQPVAPRVEPDLHEASDRVLHAARLFRAGKIKRVLVSGGNFPWLAAVKPEAELIKSLLIEWGVPAAAIEIAGRSRNTYENALEIKEIRQRSGFKSALLVTSAAHMPRAMAIFQKAGLPVVASTTDILVFDGASGSVFRWLPDAAALTMTTNAVKEWIGFWAYRARGYL